jgi:hypothetical protein
MIIILLDPCSRIVREDESGPVPKDEIAIIQMLAGVCHLKRCSLLKMVWDAEEDAMCIGCCWSRGK